MACIVVTDAKLLLVFLSRITRTAGLFDTHYNEHRMTGFESVLYRTVFGPLTDQKW